ncbi:MAG: response regulator [Pseudomonadota bacterium]
MMRVVFVDDEENILSGLKRMLRVKRREWDMAFAQSADAALEMMAVEPFHVIVSDMRMPGKDGVALLTEVMEKYPDTIRIALSGHADMEMILESVRATHQYLAKPCDAETLIATIDGARKLQDMLRNEKLKKLVSRMDRLPSLPSLYLEVMSEIREGGSLAKIGKIIAKDVAMTAKVLQLVNSAYFGLRRHIESPAQAATLLGLDVIRSLVLSTKVFSNFEQKNPALDLQALWSHSSKVGSLAKEIAIAEEASGKVRDNALMAGMLHGVGKLVLGAGLPEEYRKVAEVMKEKGLTEAEAEREVLGSNQAEVGAYLLGMWGLPNPIVEAVAYHQRPGAAGGDRFSVLTAVHAADAIVRANGAGDVPPDVDMEYLARLGLESRVAQWTTLWQELNTRKEVA